MKIKMLVIGEWREGVPSLIKRYDLPKDKEVVATNSYQDPIIDLNRWENFHNANYDGLFSVYVSEDPGCGRPLEKNIYVSQNEVHRCQITSCSRFSLNYTREEEGYSSDIFVIVLDLSKSVKELHEIIEWIERDIKKFDVVRAYVGTKSDRCSDMDSVDKLNKVLIQAKVPDIIERYSTCAKTGDNVTETFETIVKNAIPIIEEKYLRIQVAQEKAAQERKLALRKYTVNEFKNDYQQQYQAELFKNPKSWMKQTLETSEVVRSLNFNSIFQHAKQSGGRTAKVLRAAGFDLDTLPEFDDKGTTAYRK